MREFNLQDVTVAFPEALGHLPFPHLKTVSWSSERGVDLHFFQDAPLLQKVKTSSTFVVVHGSALSVENLELEFWDDDDKFTAIIELLATLPRLRRLKLYDLHRTYGQNRCNVNRVLRSLRQWRPQLCAKLSSLVIENLRMSKREVCALSRSRDPAREANNGVDSNDAPLQLLVTLRNCFSSDIKEADHTGLTQALGVDPTVLDGRNDVFDSEEEQDYEY
jgi:hypothetical protein